MQQSMFSSGEPLASHSPSQACEKGWPTPVETWPSRFLHWLRDIAPVGSSGRTSPAFCHRMEDGILVPSSGAWGNSGMGSPTECLTLSTVEHAAFPERSPSDGAVCSLSDILETGDVPRRFFLTERACAGILRRAEKRGKELPEALRSALEAAGRRP